MSRHTARVDGYPSRMQLGILGGGRMGEALAVGLTDAGWDPETIVIAEVDAERRHAVEARLPGVRIVPSPSWAAAEADAVVVAVKPADVVPALTSCIDALRDGALVLSIAAGVTLAVIEAALPGRPVVRAMPNTGALVGCAASAIAAGAHVTEGDLELAERLLGAVGLVVRVSEPQLDAVTGLSGSGPAYLFLVAEAMIEAGVLMGLTRDTSATLVRQTMLGAATLLGDGTEGPEALRAAVTSPGGTTAAGLRVLEARGVRAAFLEAIEAATERSELLGRDS